MNQGRRQTPMNLDRYDFLPIQGSSLDRRRFLIGSVASAASFTVTFEGLTERLRAEQPSSKRPVEPARRLQIGDRIRGLWLGSLLGDALGGPIEFQDPALAQRLPGGPKRWERHETLTAEEKRKAAERLALLPYAPLRPIPEPYAHWSDNAPAGTITDDSRHKLILWHAVRASQQQRERLTEKQFAQSYLSWPQSSEIQNRPGYAKLAGEWLYEYHLAARWILGERDPALALPVDRIWGGWPTCCGQMALPPLATLYPGQPVEAYRHAFEIDFIDVAWGKDLNCGLVAALSEALVTTVDPADPRPAWDHLFETLITTDPYRFQEVPWSERAAVRWLNLGRRLASEAEHRPAELFARLSREFAHTTKWHAEVPFVVIIACLEIADYDPLAALQLSLEWGEDTDSYAQLLGAFIGALYGASLFSPSLVNPVIRQLKESYGVELDELAAPDRA